MSDPLDFLNALPPPPSEPRPVMQTRAGVIFGGIGLAALVGARFAYYFFWTMPHVGQDNRSTTPPIVIAASDLHANFVRNPRQFAAEFEGKIVDVEGIVAKIDVSPNGKRRVWLYDQDGKAIIVGCLFSKASQLPRGVAVSDQVSIRGCCHAAGKIVGLTDADMLGDINPGVGPPADMDHPAN